MQGIETRNNAVLDRLYTYQRWVVEVIVYYSEWTSWNGHAPKIDKNGLFMLFCAGSIGTVKHFFRHLIDFWLKLTQVINEKYLQWSFTSVTEKQRFSFNMIKGTLGHERGPCAA